MLVGRGVQKGVEWVAKFAMPLVYIAAALIGAWLAYTAFSERGPQVTITFKSGEGLTAGKTKVKYKDIEVGMVESVSLAGDLSHVVVTAELTRGAERYLTHNTRFWVERARVSAGQVSGLGTIFSGAYIGMDPVLEGERERLVYLHRCLRKLGWAPGG